MLYIKRGKDHWVGIGVERGEEGKKVRNGVRERSNQGVNVVMVRGEWCGVVGDCVWVVLVVVWAGEIMMRGAVGVCGSWMGRKWWLCWRRGYARWWW